MLSDLTHRHGCNEGLTRFVRRRPGVETDFSCKEVVTAILVLTRKTSETIVIDGPATVTFLGIKGERVRLGIEAPPSTRITRGELLKEDDDAEA